MNSSTRGKQLRRHVTSVPKRPEGDSSARLHTQPSDGSMLKRKSQPSFWRKLKGPEESKNNGWFW
jgi:hypothetical protein